MTGTNPHPPKKKVSRARMIFDWIAGLTLLAIGVAGFFLPILQGWLFVLAGLAVLSSHSVWARAIYDRLRGAGRKVRDRLRRHRDRKRPEGAPRAQPDPGGGRDERR